MASKHSAGILLYRLHAGQPEVLLVHPGGPFWAKKDDGAWFLPKGELKADEEPLGAARREFQEELGCEPPAGQPLALGSVKNKSGKLIDAWALEGDLDTSRISSNSVSIEWPPRSGRQHAFPEVDQARFFIIPDAQVKMHAAEQPFLARLQQALLAGTT